MLKPMFPYLFFTSIVSAFIPPFLLFKGCNQATHNIRNQGFFIAVSSYTQEKINHHTNHESCFPEKSLMQNCPNNCTNLNSMSLSSYLLTATPVHNTCFLLLYNRTLIFFKYSSVCCYIYILL